MDQEEVKKWQWMSVYHIIVHLEKEGLNVGVPRQINYLQQLA